MLFLRIKLCFKLVNKIIPKSPNQNRVDTYETPVFAPDYSATVLAAKMST